MRLPRNRREFAFLLVVSLIPVNLIAPTLTCMELGFSPEAWTAAYPALAFVWLLVVACVLLTKIDPRQSCFRVPQGLESHEARSVTRIPS